MLKNSLREPLLHFFLIGLALFLVFDIVNTDRQPADEIRVTPAAATRLAAGFQAAWKRNPTQAELTGLIDNHILEEIFVREAVSLGLDQNDAVIRRRLRSKMEFLTTAAAEALQPGASELQAHFEANSARFTPPPQIAFSQVYLGLNPTDTEIAEATSALIGGVDARQIGQSSLLPPSLPLLQASTVNSNFGAGFFAQIWALHDGAWAGPVYSGYGVHLVRIERRQPGALPALADIRDQVLADWTRIMTEDFSAKQSQALLQRYQIVRPTADELAGVLK